MMADPGLTTHRALPERRQPWVEYRFYFAVIFLLALPFALVQWLYGFLRGTRGNAGVLHRALSEARTITPMIFSA